MYVPYGRISSRTKRNPAKNMLFDLFVVFAGFELIQRKRKITLYGLCERFLRSIMYRVVCVLKLRDVLRLNLDSKPDWLK